MSVWLYLVSFLMFLSAMDFLNITDSPSLRNAEISKRFLGVEAPVAEQNNSPRRAILIMAALNPLRACMHFFFSLL